MRCVSGASASASLPTIHFVLAETDGQRRAMRRADHEVGIAGEDHRERVSAFQPAQRRHAASTGVAPAPQVQIEQLGYRFGVGLGVELLAGRFQFRAQFGVVLDDAVVHDRHAGGAVRMRVALGGRAMRGPSSVADAGGAGERLAIERSRPG